MVENENSERRFAASVRIGKGIRPLTQSGGLVVEDGLLTLYDGKDRVIAQGPVEHVWAHKGWLPGSGIRVHVDGTKYTLDSAGGISPAHSIGRSVSLTGDFLEWFAEHGGNVGKPSR